MPSSIAKEGATDAQVIGTYKDWNNPTKSNIRICYTTRNISFGLRQLTYFLTVCRYDEFNDLVVKHFQANSHCE